MNGSRSAVSRKTLIACAIALFAALFAGQLFTSHSQAHAATYTVAASGSTDAYKLGLQDDYTIKNIIENHKNQKITVKF